MNSILDYFNRKDKPSVVLLNPSLIPVASLAAAYNVISTLRFSGISELSFTYPMSIDNGKTKTEGYDNIKNKMLIELEGVGRYIISECPESSDGSIPVKNVVAQSLESELLYKRIVGLSGTFPFIDNPISSNSIMGKVINLCQNWSTGTIDSELYELYRTFDVGNNTVYNFLTSNVAKAFNCVFTFNTLSRTINATLINNLKDHTGAFISLDNINRNITVGEFSDEICTALNCYGGTDLDIHRVNPLGTNTIYNFDYYINDKTNKWMTDNLKIKLNEWKNKTIGKEQDYREITLKNNIAIEEYTKINEKVEEYQNILTALQITLEGLQAIPTTTEDENTRATRLAEIDKTLIDIANTQIAIRKARSDKALKRQEIDLNSAQLRIITNSLKFTGKESWQALSDDAFSIITNFSKIANDWRAVIFETADNLEIDIPQFSANIPSIESLIADISSELSLLHTNVSDKLIQYWYLNSSDKTGISAHINIISEKINDLCYMFDNLISNTDMAIDLRSDSKLLWSYGSIVNNNSNLTKEEYEELEHFIFYNTYTNNNIIITDIMSEEEIQKQALLLYDQSVEVLSRTSNPRYEVSGNFISVINAPEFSDLVNKLDLGKQVTMELPDGENHVDLTLLEISYNYDMPDSFAMTFSNRVKLNTSNFKFADMFLGITGGDNSGLSGITSGAEYKSGGMSDSQLTGTNLLSVTNALISKLGFVSFGPTPPQSYGNFVGTWIGYDKGAKLSLYSSATDYLQWTGEKLLIKAKNFTLDSNGNITANNADLSGKITAASGDIAGWKIEPNRLTSSENEIILDSYVPKITLGTAQDYMTGNGVFIGKSSGSYAFYIGDINSDYIAWSSGEGIVSGGDWIAGWTLKPTALYSGEGESTVTINSLPHNQIDLPAFSAGGSFVEYLNPGEHEAEINSIPFRVYHDGRIYATSGSIGGWNITNASIEKGYIQLNSNSCRINVGNIAEGKGIIIDGVGYIQSSNYIDSATGFKIYNNGDAEFNNVNVRGEIRSAVFKYDEISAVAGTIGVFKSSAVLIYDSVFIDLQTPMIISTELPCNFELNDIIRIKDNVAKDVWAKITGSSIISGSQTNYYCSVQYASAGAYTFKAGTTVVNYGKTGDGYLWMRAADSMGGSTVRPYYSVRTSGSSPWNDGFIEHVRLGSLTGALNTGFDLDGKYGIVIGNSGSYLIYNSDDGMRIKGDITADSGYLTNLTINGVLTLDTNGRLQQGSGTWGTDFTGTAIWSESGAMNIGGLNNNVKQWWGGSDGKFYAGNGYITIDRNGVRFNHQTGTSDDASALKFSIDNNVFYSMEANSDEVLSTFVTNLASNVTPVRKQDWIQANGPAGAEYRMYVFGGKSPIDIDTSALVNIQCWGNDNELEFNLHTTDWTDPIHTVKRGETKIYGAIEGGISDTDSRLTLTSYSDSSTYGLKQSTIDLWSRNDGNASLRWNKIDLTSTNINLNGIVSTTGGLHVGGTSDPGIDNLVVDGTIKDSAGNAYGRPVFLTTPKTSTSWDGDTKTTANRAIVDLSAVFGVPAGVKAVLMTVQTRGDIVNEYIRFGPNSTYNYALSCRTLVAGVINIVSGIVPCDSNGDVYCYPSDTIEEVYVWIWGYWL